MMSSTDAADDNTRASRSSFRYSIAFMMMSAGHDVQRESLVASVTEQDDSSRGGPPGGDEPLPNPVEKESRNVRSASTASFLLTAAAIPVWAVTVVPMNLVYTAGKVAMNVMMSPFLMYADTQQDGESARQSLMDSGFVVDHTTVFPRDMRTYDIVVLGATGFTGRLCVRYLAKTYGCHLGPVKWAVAGRSREKLEQLKRDLAHELDMEDLLKVDIKIVDTSVPATLRRLVEQTRVVATTVGPYAVHGSHVVEFCAKFGTHYVDITNEPQWVKAMVLRWQATAKKTGAKIISFCGSDCVPWDLSAMKLSRRLRKERNDEIQSVTFWDQFSDEPPGGAYASAFSVIEGEGVQPPKDVDVDPFLRLPDGTKSSHTIEADNPVFISKSACPWACDASKSNNSSQQQQQQQQQQQRWTGPYTMSRNNALVVGWSHALRQEGSKTLHYREYCLEKDFQSAFVRFSALRMFSSMFHNPITGSFFRHFLLPKPGEGPSMEDMEKQFYLCVLGEGVGAKGNKVQSVMYFPKDPGCLETSRMLIESGLSLALQEDELPNKSGGFWTPSTGLGKILLERLTMTGTLFESRVIPADQNTQTL